MPANLSKILVVVLFVLIFVAFGLTVWWGQHRRGYSGADDLGGSAEKPAPPAATYRLSLIDPILGATVLSGVGEAPEEVVLLVHGLDDPGWTWSTMIDALVKDGHDVARFDYPNDQPIADSATMLHDALRTLKSRGVRRVSIVAHSMGGLVARDLLTRPGFYAGDGRGGEQRPDVTRLIMLGTPNHGSVMARLRGISEIGEQISRAWLGERDLFRFLDDGDGGAGVDLLPDSAYLKALNARPLSSNVAYTIVAGAASPVDESLLAGELVDRLVEGLNAAASSDRLPAWARDGLAAAGSAATREWAKGLLADLASGVGDGCVSLESARLEGVEDFTVVEADHIGMIINLLGTDETPPSIPIVLERIGDGGP